MKLNGRVATFGPRDQGSNPSKDDIISDSNWLYGLHITNNTILFTNVIFLKYDTGLRQNIDQCCWTRLKQHNPTPQGHDYLRELDLGKSQRARAQDCRVRIWWPETVFDHQSFGESCAGPNSGSLNRISRESKWRFVRILQKFIFWCGKTWIILGPRKGVIHYWRYTNF